MSGLWRINALGSRENALDLLEVFDHEVALLSCEAIVYRNFIGRPVERNDPTGKRYRCPEDAAVTIWVNGVKLQACRMHADKAAAWDAGQKDDRQQLDARGGR